MGWSGDGVKSVTTFISNWDGVMKLKTIKDYDSVGIYGGFSHHWECAVSCTHQKGKPHGNEKDSLKSADIKRTRTTGKNLSPNFLWYYADCIEKKEIRGDKQTARWPHKPRRPQNLREIHREIDRQRLTAKWSHKPAFILENKESNYDSEINMRFKYVSRCIYILVVVAPDIMSDVNWFKYI